MNAHEQILTIVKSGVVFGIENCKNNNWQTYNVEDHIEVVNEVEDVIIFKTEKRANNILYINTTVKPKTKGKYGLGAHHGSLLFDAKRNIIIDKHTASLWVDVAMGKHGLDTLLDEYRGFDNLELTRDELTETLVSCICELARATVNFEQLIDVLDLSTETKKAFEDVLFSSFEVIRKCYDVDFDYELIDMLSEKIKGEN